MTRLRKFREHGVHVLGSFIFGLPSDRATTFDATADIAERAGVTFAQFVMLTPFPGTLDFAAWEKTLERRHHADRRHPDHPPLADSAGAASEGVHAAPGDVRRRDPRADAGGLGSVLQLPEDLGARASA